MSGRDILEYSDQILFLIKWGPTIMFLFIVLGGTFIGLFRGFRKSLIMLIHAIVAFIICIIVYFIIVDMEFVDELILKIINLFMGDNGLQTTLGVSTSCTGIKEVILEYVIYSGSYGDGISLLIKDNGAYVATIVDMSYRIIAALAMYILYLILIGIMYIIYQIFYPERKYIKKKKAAFVEAKSDRNYDKQMGYGMLIGGFRGLVSALILLSFIGSLLYITTGGKGEATLEPISFGDEKTTFVYDAYRSIESYGAQGIYKFLNQIDDKNEMPYYLFAADIVLQGELVDENRGVSENVILREELGSYTKFARESFNLVMKYGGEEIRASILNDTEDKEMMDIILEVMTIKEFQKEFRTLIEEFDTKVYMSNLTLSLLDSIVENIDDLEFTKGLNSEAVEIIKILFKEGYLSNQIPSEKVLLEEISNGADSNLDKYKLPYINASHLINKDDVLELYDIAMACIGIEEDASNEYVLSIVKEIIPNIGDLTILSDERKDEINPVLGRLYSYVEAKYLGSTVNTAEEYLEDSSVDWIYELNVLVSSSLETITLYENIYAEDKDVLDILLNIFNPETENYYINTAIYDRLLNNISSSKLLGKVLSTNEVFTSLKEGLVALAPGLVLDDDIVFENRYDSNGNIIYGEAYQLLSAVKILGAPENRVIIDNLRNSQQIEMKAMLNDISTALFNTDENGNALIDYLLESRIVNSVLSAFLINNKQISNEYALYIPDLVLEQDDNGNSINIIKEDVLRDLFYKLPDLLELVNPVLEDPTNKEKILELLKSELLYDMLNNLIIEGTISSITKSYLKDSETIIIPKSYESLENWISTDNTEGELKKIIGLINKSGLDIGVFVNESTNDQKFDEIIKISKVDSDALIDSNIIYYTISNYVINSSSVNGIEIIVPMSSKVELEDDSINYVINKIELIDLLSKIDLFMVEGENQFNQLFKNFVINRNILITNKIALATFVNYIVNNADFNNNVGSSIIIPDSYKQSGSRENLLDFKTTNAWNNEAPMLLQAIDELFNISSREDELSFDSVTLTNELNNAVASLNTDSNIVDGRTKLEVCYESDVIVASISSRLDEGFRELVDDSVRNSAKINGLYTFDEIHALVNIIDVFDIEVGSTSSINSLEDKILNEFITYNEPREEEEFNGRSTIEIISDSIMIRRVLSDNIDKEIEATVYSINDLDIAKDAYGAYTYKELSGLIDALRVFGITNIREEEINVDEKLFTLTSNDIAKLYKSYVAIYIINKALDDSILGNSNDLSDDLAFEDTLNNDVIKTNEGLDIRKYYLEEEINDLLTVLKELGVSTLDELKVYDFKSCIHTLNERPNVVTDKATRLDVLYDSYIFDAIVTKQILDESNKEGSMIMHHPFAYIENAEIYRKIEIQSLSDILRGKNIDEFDVNELTLDDLEPYIYDEYGNTRSYLMVSTVSLNIFNNPEIVVPSYELDRHVKDETIILPRAIGQLIKATRCLGVTKADFNMGDIIAPQSDSDVETVLASEIARATITYNIVIQNQPDNEEDFRESYSVEEDILKTTNQIGNTILVLTEDALRKLFISVHIINEGSLSIYVDINKVKELYALGDGKLEEVLASTLVSIAVSDAVIKEYGTLPIQLAGISIIEETVYDLSIPNRTFTKDIVSTEDIINVLDKVSGI